MSLEVALLEWSKEGQVRMLGRSGDPHLVSLVQESLVEQITGYEERRSPPLTLVPRGQEVSDEEVES
jgi:hypothetical protein